MSEGIAPDHTAGPWKSELLHPSDTDHRYVIWANGELLADLEQPLDRDWDEAKANARLIAAAPCLRHALEQVEWAGLEANAGGAFPACPCCGALHNLANPQHEEGCALRAALDQAKAGA